MVVTVVEAVKIQSYVFGSNRLRENTGASYLVWAATERWPLEAVRDLCPDSSNIDNSTLALVPGKEVPGVDAEVIYAGGGNCLVLFKEPSTATKFAQVLSKRALEEAPGLRLLVAREEFDWDSSTSSLRDAVDAAFKRLDRMKRAPSPSVPLPGVAATVPCGSTGQPAVGWVKLPDGSKQPASAEVLAKDKAAARADRRLAREAGEAGLPEDYRFPLEFDNLGRAPGEFSYIAVGHADGDSMGELFQRVADKSQGDRDYVDRMRALSRGVSESGEAAFRAVLNSLVTKIGDGRGDGGGSGKVIGEPGPGGELVAEVELQSEDDHWYLPFRPLIFGGDDFTFVSDGRLGLALLQKFMHAFRKAAEGRRQDLGNQAVTASGGVAIVKAHYPFARAYALAEELCHSAKHYRKETGVDEPFLDWHFAQAGLLGSLGEIRDRLYKTPYGSLLLRPVRLEEDLDDPRSWPVVARGIDAFRSDDWFGRRNKMKALMTALREGPEAVKRFRTLYNDDRRLPHLHQQRLDWPNAGWEGDACGYFDSLELVDWYISL